MVGMKHGALPHCLGPLWPRHTMNCQNALPWILSGGAVLSRKSRFSIRKIHPDVTYFCLQFSRKLGDIPGNSELGESETHGDMDLGIFPVLPSVQLILLAGE